MNERSIARIDLRAVAHNVDVLRRRAPNSRLMAVVKADAYGHGAVPVARTALEAGAEELAVATVEEGEELRWAGVRAPVLVLTDVPGEKLYAARDLGLRVAAHSLRSARAIAAVDGLEADLKVNTGMNRWGVEPEEVPQAASALGPRMRGIYTHLACADTDAKTTKRQLKIFEEVLAGRSFSGVTVHAANSAATLWHYRSHYDCVRPGVALYGLHPAGDSGDPFEEGLRPAMSLKSYVACVRPLKNGEGVSYGLTFRAERDMYVATVPVGYAEGYRRALSGRGWALIGGRRRPLLGRVTMDAVVFGVDEDVQAGDEVVLLGEQGEERIGAEELGRLASTINYEITTGVNPRRVKRSYEEVL